MIGLAAVACSGGAGVTAGATLRAAAGAVAVAGPPGNGVRGPSPLIDGGKGPLTP